MRFLRPPALCFLFVACAACKPAAKLVPLTLQPDCNPFATTSECLFPFPSSFFQSEDSTSPTGVRVSYPAGIFGASSTGVKIDVTPYNTADGAPAISPLLAFFAADVDLTNLPGQHQIADSVEEGTPIAIFDLETGARVPYFAEMEENRDPAQPNRYALILRPVAPMAMGHRHAVIISDAVKLADGSALPVSPAFAALRDATITDNSLLESVRDRYENIFAMADALGYPREHISLAWDFMVASEDYLLGPIRAMRAQALQEIGASGEGYKSGALTYTIDTIKPTDTGGELVEGTFQVTNYINSSQQFDWDDNHLPIEQPQLTPSPQYTMYIPKEDLAPGGTPLPLGIFGHGLLGTGRGYLDTDGNIAGVIQGMAERVGAVLIATDWTGLSGTQDDEVVGLTVATDINQLGRVTDRLAQSLINNLAMTKLGRGALGEDARVKPADHALIDQSHTVYYGVSLGGIQGASLVSISDDISRGVLAVPGAAWSTMFPRSVDWLQFQTYALPTYPDPLEQTKLLALMQARFDFTDGANLTRMLLAEPLPDAPAKTVLLQEAIDDCQVQNVATEILARAIGVSQLRPSYSTVFPLAQVASSSTGSALSQYYLTNDVKTYQPPDTDVAALQDNGAHFDLNLLPNGQQQIIQFMGSGSIEQFCSGICDPN